MKRLLCILDSLDAGGAETFLIKIIRSIPSEKCKFDFIVSVKGGIYSEEILKRGGKIYEVPPRRKDFRGAFWKIKSIVEKNQYEHVLKFGESPIMVMDLLAAKLGGAKYLGARSCNALRDLSYTDKVIDFFMRPILNVIANIKIAPSVLAADYTFGKHARKSVHLLNNGVDLDVFRFDKEGRDTIRKEFELEGKFVVGHIGRFHKQKNHEYLLSVFQEIKQQREDSVLLLVGTGELKEKIQVCIKELQLESAVIFTGVRFDIPQLLSAMDVFVFPSFYEGMPNTVIEAQSTGLPCIISDTITQEADITGIVKYLSLYVSPKVWANLAVKFADSPRCNTYEDFLKKGYDIQSVAAKMLSFFELD